MPRRRNDPRVPVPRRVPAERPGPIGGKRDENRRQRVQALCHEGLRLFLEHGVEAVTVDAVARGASMAKGSFYRYFQGKEELVEAVLSPLARDLDGAFGRCEAAIAQAHDEPALTAAYQGLAAGLAKAIVNHPDTVRLYLQECRSPAVGSTRPVRLLADSIMDRATGLTAAAHGHTLLRPGFDTRLSTLVVVGAAERLMFELLGDPASVGGPLQAAQGFISLMLHGIGNPGLGPGRSGGPDAAG